MTISRKPLLYLVIFILQFVICTPTWSAEPTLARLSFRVPEDQMAAFEATYRQKVVPFLKRRGMVPHSDVGRPTVKDAFSRLFVFQSVKL